MKILRLLIALTLLPALPSSAAISFDAGSALQNGTTGAGISPVTYSMTVGSGANRMLFVGVSVTASTATPTVTYASVAMTAVGNVTWFFGGGKVWLFALPNPTSGTNTVSIQYAAATAVSSSAASYAGVNQSTTPDASTTATGSAAAATLTLTTVAANCWSITFARNGGTSVVSAGSGATLRTTSSGVAGTLDSNGPLSAGSTSETVTFTPSTQYGVVMVSFAPASSGPAPPNNALFFSGE